MQYWIAYTGRDMLAGRGRAIRRVMADTSELRRIVRRAEETDVPAAIPARTFMAAVSARLAMRELDVNERATVFRSVQQMRELFDGLDMEQLAINLLNGRTAGAYTEHADILRGFADGELLFLPRDAARLHRQETLERLPGLVAYALAEGQEKSRAFTAYLRRGVPPLVNAAALLNHRRVMRTWEREARQEKEQRKAMDVYDV